jgi:hypothetical protein
MRLQLVASATQGRPIWLVLVTFIFLLAQQGHQIDIVLTLN